MKRTLIATCAALAATAAVPAGAVAAKQPVTAVFDVTVSADTEASWSLRKTQTDPCGVPHETVGEGRQDTGIRMGDRSARVTFTRVDKGSPYQELTNGRPYVSSIALWNRPATANREGSLTITAHGPDDCLGGTGGGGPAPEKDCGIAGGFIDVELAYAARDRLRIGGRGHGYENGFQPLTPDGPNALHDVFVNCPFWEGTGLSGELYDGGLLPAEAKLPEAKLFDPGVKRFTLKAAQDTCYAEGGVVGCGHEAPPFVGRASSRYEVVMKRVGGTGGQRECANGRDDDGDKKIDKKDPGCKKSGGKKERGA